MFGLPIFMGYYTYHNMDEKYIGFIPTDASTKRYLKQDAIPTAFLLAGAWYLGLASLAPLYICAVFVLTA